MRLSFLNVLAAILLLVSDSIDARPAGRGISSGRGTAVSQSSNSDIEGAHGTPANAADGMEILYQNDLSNTVNPGVLLLYRLSESSESAARDCSVLGETLLSKKVAASEDTLAQLAYLAGIGKIKQGDAFWIDSTLVRFDGKGLATVPASERSAGAAVLCSNDAPATAFTLADRLPQPAFYGKGRRVAVRSKGYSFTGVWDRRSFRFLGIPYADAPIGPRRFMHSVPYTGKREIDATSFGPACIQPPSNQLHPHVDETSEDCLTLNVFTSSLPPSGEDAEPVLKPVWVFIHGGGYVSGRSSTPMYDGSMVSRGDIVLVTFNYRLGALGLLASGDDLPGNAAISDQVMVLKWVQDHIRAFGGDPDKVTVGGQSAGAQSTSAILSTEASSGLYRSAVMQSAPDYPWHTRSVATNIVTPAIAGMMQCPTSGPAMVECMQNVDANKLSTILSQGDNKDRYSRQMMSFYNGTAQVSGGEPFQPTVDGKFIQDQWFYHLGNGTLPNKVPLLIGSMTGEGTVFIEQAVQLPLLPTRTLYGFVVRQLFPTTMAQSIVSSGLFNLASESDSVRNAMDRIMTLGQWTCPTYGQVREGVATKALPRTYLYEMDAGTSFTAEQIPAKCLSGKTGLGACHGNDLLTTMGTLNVLGSKDSEEMLSYTRRLNDIWTAFVRTTDPNLDLAYHRLRGRSYEESLQSSDTPEWAPVSLGNEGPNVRRLYFDGFSSAPYGYPQQCTFLEQNKMLGHLKINNGELLPPRRTKFAGPFAQK